MVSSFEFHRGIETFREFAQREWRVIAVCGGLFIAGLIAVIFMIDPAFFYPRIQTDPMWYWLKGLAFAETGRTTAYIGINHKPISYVGMPGVLRSPLMMMFSDFDSQLRAIQLTNVLLVAVTAVMYAYIFSWAIPRNWRWVTVPFSFAFISLSPIWIINVFSLLGEAPYAALAAVVMILLVRIMCGEVPLRNKSGLIAIATFCFLIAFLVKFTAPLLLLFGVPLAIGRARSGGMSVRTLYIGLAASATTVVLLIFTNTLSVERYRGDLVFFWQNAEKKAMAINLIASAIPAQIIPNFNLAFTHQPTEELLRPVFGATTGDAIVAGLGIALSAIVLVGIWRVRKRFAPEIVYFLTGLPVLAAIIPSTARYLIAYQPIIWIFFLAGLAWLVTPVAALLPSRRAAIVAGVMGILALGGVLTWLRLERLSGSASRPNMTISLSRIRGYVDDVARTFRAEREFIDGLPRDRTLLMGDLASSGRWTVIAGRQYYFPDPNLPKILAEKDVYLVTECGTMEGCQDFKWWDQRLKTRVLDSAQVAFDSVFASGNRYAKARVYKLRVIE